MHKYSWLQHLKFSSDEKSHHYTLLLPADYYECRFTRKIPKGTAVLTNPHESAAHLLPNYILAQFETDPNNIYENKLIKDVDSEIIRIAGDLSSPEKVIQDYKRLKNYLEKSLEFFKDRIKNSEYIIDESDKPELYRLRKINDNVVLVGKFGPLKEVFEKVNQYHEYLNRPKNVKTWRSNEFADLLKLERLVDLLSNIGDGLDRSRLKDLFDHVLSEPKHSYKMSWKDIYKKIYKNISTMYNRLDKFDNYKWYRYMRDQ